MLLADASVSNIIMWLRANWTPAVNVHGSQNLLQLTPWLALMLCHRVWSCLSEGIRVVLGEAAVNTRLLHLWLKKMLKLMWQLQIVKTETETKNSVGQVFDLVAGHFGHQRGPFWTRTMRRFGSLVISQSENSTLCINEREIVTNQSPADDWSYVSIVLQQFFPSPVTYSASLLNRPFTQTYTKFTHLSITYHCRTLKVVFYDLPGPFMSITIRVAR